MNMEQSIRFYDWMATRRTMPQFEDVMTHFEVCRATAYRWLDAYRSARGIVQIQPDYGERFVPVDLPTRRPPWPAWLFQHQGMTTE
jgi:hypothetical protein